MVIIGGPEMEERNYLLVDWSKSIHAYNPVKPQPQKYMCGMFYTTYKECIKNLNSERFDIEAAFLWNNDFGVIPVEGGNSAEIIYQPYSMPITLRGYLIPVTVGLDGESKLVGYVIIQEHDDFVPDDKISIVKRIGGYITSFFKKRINNYVR